MTRQLDTPDLRNATAPASHAVGTRRPRGFGAAGPLRTESLADGGVIRPMRPRPLESVAGVFAAIGATGFGNPGEQIRAWTVWLTAINLAMALALALALFAIFR